MGWKEWSAWTKQLAPLFLFVVVGVLFFVILNFFLPGFNNEAGIIIIAIIFLLLVICWFPIRAIIRMKK